MTEHTPGPWKVSSERPLFGFWQVRQDPLNWDGNGYQAICTVPASTKNTPYGDMFRANARLIAAAPDLLAALREIDRSWTKAFPQGPDGEFKFGIDIGEDHKTFWRNARAAIAKATGSLSNGENHDKA